MRRLHRLSHDTKGAVLAALCCAVFYAAPALAQGATSPQGIAPGWGDPVVGQGRPADSTANVLTVTVTAPVPTGGTEAVNGSTKVSGSGRDACTATQVGSIRYNPAGNYFELCSYP
jgi:hypothetical protein